MASRQIEDEIAMRSGFDFEFMQFDGAPLAEGLFDVVLDVEMALG
jgi:hypothetical protein